MYGNTIHVRGNTNKDYCIIYCLPRKGVSDKPMRFDSYIREIVSKLSNPMGLPDTPRWVKWTQTIDWYIMILMKLICTCLSHCSSDISRAKITTLVKLCPDRILVIGR